MSTGNEVSSATALSLWQYLALPDDELERADNAEDLYGRWPSLPYDEKRKITECLTHKITVGKGEIDIDLCYLPPAPSSELMSKGQRNV